MPKINIVSKIVISTSRVLIIKKFVKTEETNKKVKKIKFLIFDLKFLFFNVIFLIKKKIETSNKINKKI